MTVDLKWVLLLSIFLAVLGFLVGAGSSFTDLGLAPATVKAVIALCVILLGAGNAVNSVLVAFGMTNAGRLASVASVPLVAKMDALANNNPEIKSIVTTQALAEATDSEKVVGPLPATGTKL
jgi:hypothetical protein